MAPILVFSRRGCHLCEVLIEELLPLAQGRLPVEVCDVDETPELRDRYGEHVPVVEFNGREICRFRLDKPAIRALVAEAAQGD